MDPVIGIPWDHVNFILRYYMLVPDPIDLGIVKEVDSGHLLFTGSVAEGLNLPFHARVTSDIDMMMVVNGYHAIDVETPTCDMVKQIGGLVFWFTYSDKHPGYVQLTECKIEEDSNLQLYPMGNEMVNKLIATVGGKNVPPSAAYQHGPAFTVIRDKFREELPEELKKQEILVEEDYVFALPCKEWPRLAGDWEERARASCCLQEDLIEDIVRSGCHIVPVGIEGSEKPLWRLSFSLAEVKRARRLTPVQRRCYLLLKSLHTVHLKELKGTVTYQLKNILFWECERLHPDKWTMDDLAECTFSLLEVLKRGLEQGRIPHYFVPENNLIARIEEETRLRSIEKIKWIRSNAIQAVRECDAFFRNDATKFQRFAVIEKAINNREDDRSCFLSFYSDMIFACVAHKDIAAALLYMEDCIERLVPDNELSVNLLYHILHACNEAGELADLQTNIVCLRIAVKAYDRLKLSDQNLAVCLVNLAGLLHADIVEKEDSGEIDQDLRSECKELFEKSMSMCKDVALQVCTANFLLYIRKFKNALDILMNREISTDFKGDFDNIVTFQRIEFSVLPKIMSQESKQGNEIVIPAIVFASFLRVLCHLEIKNESHATEELEILERLAGDSNNTHQDVSKRLIADIKKYQARLSSI